VLSLFPGIGLLDMALEEEGFCVVRGPDLLWGGDIRRFYPPAGKFNGVIGGTPCQAFSPLRKLVEHAHLPVAADLIPEFERCVCEAGPEWFLMENVPGAPLPTVPGYIVKDQLIRDVAVGGETNRLRRFSFGTVTGLTLSIEWAALHRTDPAPTVLASGGYAVGVKRGEAVRKWRKGASAAGFKTKSVWEYSRRLQGLPNDFLADAPFTVAGKIKAVGNGVPLAMGRAVARAVKAALALGREPRNSLGILA
jgi:DNA (cytosine-5)-methyltransferase 1